MREEAILTEYVIDAHTNTREGRRWGGVGRELGGEKTDIVLRVKKTQGHISFLCSLSYPLITYKYTKYIECSEVTYKHKNQKPIQTKTYQRERET